jgi:hypothetical protein
VRGAALPDVMGLCHPLACVDIYTTRYGGMVCLLRSFGYACHCIDSGTEAL